MENVNKFVRNKVYLLDNYNHKLYNLKENNLINLSQLAKSNYQILIGNSDFIMTKEKEILPTEFRLYQNYPNPFNPTTTIKYSIPKSSFVKIIVYDILGNEIATLVNEDKTSGYYSIAFYANKLASGIYFYRMQAGNFVETKKLILIK